MKQIFLLNYNIVDSFNFAPVQTLLNEKRPTPVLERLGLQISHSLTHWDEKLLMISEMRRSQKQRLGRQSREMVVGFEEFLVFLRTYPKSDRAFGVIKKMFYLYAGQYLCCSKPSHKVVRLIDPDSGRDLGTHAEEQCKMWIPSSDIDKLWIKFYPLTRMY